MIPVRRPLASLVALAVVGCSHSGPFDNPLTVAGAFSTGSDIRLTFNPDQDYWPIWTEDGRGILYSFIQAEAGPQHRCLGLLPAAGGTRIWQFCDDRATQSDSMNSFSGYALGADGRLLYAEAVAQAGPQGAAPSETTLWLADSATPFQRRALLTLPTFAGTTPVAWLTDIAWTGPTTFIALGQDFAILTHCRFCAPEDSIFAGETVVLGTITATGATLQPVAGTAGATGYSLAENGASIAFVVAGDPHLFKVPATGGTAATIGVVTPDGDSQLLGVSCRESNCVIGADAVTPTTTLAAGIIFPSINAGAFELRSMALTSGAVHVLRTATTILATPQVSPVTGDVVAQVGGAFGHLQSFTAAGSDLHLYQGLVP